MRREQELEMRTKFRTEMEEPAWTKLRTEAEPSDRVAPRKEKDEASTIQSITLGLESTGMPSWPGMERPMPMLMKDRVDMVEPAVEKLSRETEPPVCTLFRIDTLDAIRV